MKEVATGELPFLLTSCCPSWSMLAKKFFPETIDKISNALTPMVATARVIKKEHPDASVAIEKCVQEYYPDTTVHIEHVESLADCKKILMLAKLGKKNGCLIEGMACPGGCIAGAGTNVAILQAQKALSSFQNEAERKLPPQNAMDEAK